MTAVLTDDVRNWVAFLRVYATRRCTALQPGHGQAPALMLFNGPRTQLGFPTLAVELEFVLGEERETVRSVIAKRLLQARREFRRRPS